MTTATIEDQAPPAAEAGETVAPTADDQSSSVEAETALEAESEDAGSGEDSTESKDDPRAELEKERRRLKRRNEKLLQDRAVERAERERLAQELARLQDQLQNPEAEKKATEPDPEKLAIEIANRRELAKKLAAVTKEGQAKFKDFEKAITELVDEIGPQVTPQGNFTPLMEAVLDSDRASEVLKYLGDNTEVASELAGLSPARLGRRISQIESELSAKAKAPKPSAAAKPLAPVKPSPPPAVDPSKLSDKEWFKLRMQEKLRA